MFATIRNNFFDKFSEKSGCVFLKAGAEITRVDTDREEIFRQDSNFFYLTGVNEPDGRLVLDLANRKYHLFMPRLPEEYKVWMTVVPLEQKKDIYQPDEMHENAELKDVIHSIGGKVHVMEYLTDAEVHELLPAGVEVDRSHLQEDLHNMRVCKLPCEIEVMREASRISSESLCAVMKKVHPGMKEYEVEAMWLYECYARGGSDAKLQAYTPIMATGKSSGTLHYIDNDKTLSPNEMILADCGCEYKLYASDISRTFPTDGHFTPRERTIYDIVLHAHKTVIESMHPGVDWTDMHRLSMRLMTEGMLKAGFLRGSMEELMENHVIALFYAHGLGHLLGIDVHDCGGYPRGGMERINLPSICKLRVRRILQPGMVLTVEPGLYFKDALLEPALHDPKMSKFLNEGRIREFWNFGGVRIEDDVVVTETGHESLTKVPKECADIEALMAQKN